MEMKSKKVEQEQLSDQIKNNMTTLRIQNIKKSYKNKDVVKDISL